MPVLVAPLSDALIEGLETVTATISSSKDYRIGQGTATVAIEDDDQALAKDDWVKAAVGVPVTVSVLGNDTLLTKVVSVGTAAGGTVAIDPGDATVMFTPAGIGLVPKEISFSYTAEDSAGKVTGSATVYISTQATEPPTTTPDTSDCPCDCDTPTFTFKPGSAFTSNPVRYADGVVSLSATDLTSAAFPGFGVTRQWTNQEAYAAGDDRFGTNVVEAESPRLIASGGSVWALSGGTGSTRFDPSGGGYAAVGYSADTLTAGSGTLVLTTAAGPVLTFQDFSYGTAALRGRLVSQVDPTGEETTVTYTADGGVDAIERTRGSGADEVAERLEYAYYSGGSSDGRVESVTLTHRDGGSGPFTDLFQATYTYYTPGDPNGNPGDLRTAVTTDLTGGGRGDASYYRYYRLGDANGYPGGVKFVVRGAQFDRLVEAEGDPYSAADVDVAPFADNYFEYDSYRRVTKEVAAGAGCSACSAGQGEYTYAYTASGNAPGANSWAVKTVETLPDGNTNTVYTNSFGQVMLKAYTDTATSDTWTDFYRMDAGGRSRRTPRRP